VPSCASGSAMISSTDDDKRDKIILMGAFHRLQDRSKDNETLRGETRWYSLS
jgi:hypothetical protein